MNTSDTTTAGARTQLAISKGNADDLSRDIARLALGKFPNLVACCSYFEAARVMQKELTPSVSERLRALNAVSSDQLTPSVLNWLNELADAILN